MNFKKITAVSVTCLLLTQNLLANAVESARCAAQKDSLDQPQAIIRTKWAFKCYPSLRGTMPGGQVMLKDTVTQQEFLGYPIFAEIDENGNILANWQAPIDENASCEGAQTHAFVGFCRAGCYTPDQMVLFSDGYQAIGAAKQQKRQDIVTLGSQATLENLQFVTNELKSYTTSATEATEPIVIVRTAVGGELRVTPGHPLVVSTGKIKQAKDIVAGDELVSAYGTFDRVSGTENTQYTGRVLNVEMPTEDVKANIVVAQGYLNGSVHYQNVDLNEINRRVLRELIPDATIR